MEECVSSLMEGGNWRSTHPLFVLRIKVLLLYPYCKLKVLMCLHFIHILSFSFLFHRNGVSGMPVGLGLGRDHEPYYGRREGMVLMPYDPLWVGQLAGLRGRTVEPAAGPRGTRCHRQYSFRRQPEVTQRDKGVTTQTCFLPRGRRAQARSVPIQTSVFMRTKGIIQPIVTKA